MCDCAVALGPNTRRGATLFGKNSDREKLEAQPLRAFAAAEHARGTRVRCTYVELEQVRRTAAVLGSRPFWCWGLEQGVNEHGVAIGNETVFTHEEFELAEPGLIGMDLVRLGLERATSAREALETIGELVERCGQGGQAFLEKPLGYSNGFLIADRKEAWSLQTSSRRWAARPIAGLGSVSNHPGIGSDWELLSSDAERFAIERGWWDSARGRFDFEAAYRSTRLVSRAFSERRQERSSALLRAGRGALDERAFFALLRDHGEGRGSPPGPGAPEAERWTLCAHDELLGDTTASMVAPLDGPRCWFALATPCTSVYLPLYLGAELPLPLRQGGATPSPDSAWWRLKSLQQAVERDFGAHHRRVRERFDRLEDEFLAWGDATDAAAERMREATARALETAEALLRELPPA